MSYLTLANGIPNFAKAVISLWFRVPKESAIAASTNNIDLALYVLPLVTFGKQQSSKTYATPYKDVAVIHAYLPGEPDASTKYNTPIYVEGPSFNVEPSYVGLSCFADGTFKMAFNIQMDGYMALRATSFVTTQMDIYSGADPARPIRVQGNGVVSLFPNVGVATIADVSYVDNAQPEFFTVTTSKKFEPDQWHHLLLSFDVGGSVSIGTPFASSDCRLWYAIDDEDYRGAENMLPHRDLGGQWGHDTLDPNAILTRNAFRFSGSDPNWEAIHYYQNHFVGLPSGRYDGGSIPSADAAIGIPSSAQYVEGIFRVEMAEFQLFSGVTLDTGIELNRRAFVDNDGNPVPPDKKKDPNDTSSGSIELLGKKPELLLHGSTDWQQGKNTGTLGLEINSDGEETIFPSGQFTPTAKIEPYEPDPSLSERPTD